MVETIDSGLAATCGCPFIAEARFGLSSIQSCVQARLVAVPNARPHFQPAFPICAPKHFLDELFGGLGAMALQCRGQNRRFGEDAVSQVWGQPGDVSMPGAVVVTVLCIVTASFWQKTVQCVKRSCVARFKHKQRAIARRWLIKPPRHDRHLKPLRRTTKTLSGHLK